MPAAARMRARKTPPRILEALASMLFHGQLVIAASMLTIWLSSCLCTACKLAMSSMAMVHSAVQTAVSPRAAASIQAHIENTR